MMQTLVQELGGWFTEDQYLYWTRIEGSLWTLADVVIVFYLIRSANILRRVAGKRLHVGSYIALATTLPFAAFLPVAPSGMFFFRLEAVVTVPHFLLILYLFVANAAVAVKTLPHLLRAEEGHEKKTETQLS